MEYINTPENEEAECMGMPMSLAAFLKLHRICWRAHCLQQQKLKEHDGMNPIPCWQERTNKPKNYTHIFLDSSVKTLYDDTSLTCYV